MNDASNFPESEQPEGIPTASDAAQEADANTSAQAQTPADDNAAVQAAVAAAEEALGDSGRVLLRPSGTEPLVRVMAEAATQEQADEVTARLAQIVADELAL